MAAIELHRLHLLPKGGRAGQYLRLPCQWKFISW
jgi:hypothetical protein